MWGSEASGKGAIHRGGGGRTPRRATSLHYCSQDGGKKNGMGADFPDIAHITAIKRHKAAKLSPLGRSSLTASRGLHCSPQHCGRLAQWWGSLLRQTAQREVTERQAVLSAWSATQSISGLRDLEETRAGCSRGGAGRREGGETRSQLFLTHLWSFSQEGLRETSG